MVDLHIKTPWSGLLGWAAVFSIAWMMGESNGGMRVLIGLFIIMYMLWLGQYYRGFLDNAKMLDNCAECGKAYWLVKCMKCGNKHLGDDTK